MPCAYAPYARLGTLFAGFFKVKTRDSTCFNSCQGVEGQETTSGPNEEYRNDPQKRFRNAHECHAKMLSILLCSLMM